MNTTWSFNKAKVFTNCQRVKKSSQKTTTSVQYVQKFTLSRKQLLCSYRKMSDGGRGMFSSNLPDGDLTWQVQMFDVCKLQKEVTSERSKQRTAAKKCGQHRNGSDNHRVPARRRCLYINVRTGIDKRHPVTKDILIKRLLTQCT